MADPVVVDVFRFVAVRPPQLSRRGETETTIMRDERADSAEGRRRLTELGRSLASPTKAAERWRRLDLDPLVPLREGNPPDLDEGELGELAELAWDALYIAEATGADAGPRLETPIAALRMIHLLRHRGEADPAELLSATPAISTAFAGALSESRVGPEPETPPEPSSDNSELRQLIEEFEATHRLLRDSTLPAGRPAPTLDEQAVESDECGGPSQMHVRLSTLPTFRTALGDRLSEQDRAVLSSLRIDDHTSLPAASMLLQQHATDLTEIVAALRGNHQFMADVVSYGASSTLLELVPAFSPGLGGVDLAAVWDRPGRPGPGTAPDVNVRGRVRPLGIGDLKVVKQTLLAYVPGEVAHIENVLKGESKERTHRTLDRTETILFTAEEETTETERDTQTTDRFELKKEAEQTIKEDMSVHAGVTVSGSYGPVTVTAHGDFAYSTSKQDSQKSSSNFARDIVDRTISKVQKKVRTERTTKTLREVEEINKHAVENIGAPDHVVGIYRWVDKRYRAQVFNYGVRMMLEFIVPEPGAFYRASQIRRAAKALGAVEPEPFVDMNGKPLTSAAITPTSYRQFASRYKASGITAPPPLWLYAGAAFGEGGLELGRSTAKGWKELTVPEGYELKYYEVGAGVVWKNHPSFILQVGGEILQWLHSNHPNAPTSSSFGGGWSLWPGSLASTAEAGLHGVVPISVATYDVTGYSINVSAYFMRTAERYETWQLQTFEKISTAYQAAKQEYDQKLGQAEASVGIAIEGRSPTANRDIEKRELKKLSISMLTGQHFGSFDAMTDPPGKPDKHPEVDIYEALKEGPIVQFFEQAFEWEHMTYLFYPYFWGRKENWVNVTAISDPDPLFAQFEQAGAARIVVPVRPAYNVDVQFYLQSTKSDWAADIWKGGNRPTLDDDDGRYVSIAEELRNRTDDLAGAVPEGQPWEFTLPTTLVWLQPDAKLPEFP